MSDEGPSELGTGNRNSNEECGGGPRRGDDIADRLLELAAGVLCLLPELGDRPNGKNVVKQLERCASAGGANYEEARGAESPADFIHKVRVALKEVRETQYWLKLIAKAKLVEGADRRLTPLINEAGELIAILTASAITARRRAESV
jgi:four helix bundle protein